MKNNHLYLLILLLFTVTNGFAQNINAAPQPIVNESNIKTSCPFFTKNSKGVPVISFAKETKENETVLCYAVFDYNKNEFQNPIIIESSKGVELHGENAPKIIFKPNNEIIAVWGIDNATEKKKYGGLVKYSQSFDNGETWTKAKSLVESPASIDQRYFDIDLLPNGEVTIIWLDSRTNTEKEGSTLYYAATVGTSGFKNEKPIAETTCQCCRTDLFISKNGVINAAFRDIINEEIRDMVLTYSTDNGKTFSEPKRISPDNWKINGCPHTGPTMTENENGLHFAWYTSGGGSGVFYCNSNDSGKSFSNRNVVSDKPSAKHPQITSLDNKDVLIVWDETVTKNDTMSVKIGLQHRDKSGKIIATKYISSKNTTATFPIIEAINKNQLLVAWSQESTDENVYYKIVTIN
ncbi:exo-alpha-sialidase [Flavobacterium sp. ZT3R18]|uniref:sialidase family protein n=1 Tax=Flavobacterium sp. ZT3R18 TaxID=2594429 RepID=UPI001179DB49|nr:sialidase family protein [Flavobacterium sp. ZT3R18]TRX36772.1 exo-alpha-sialidase [Flavobacterium sp. ZT3R18]